MLNRILAKAAAVLLLFSFPATMLPAQNSAATDSQSRTGYLKSRALNPWSNSFTVRTEKAVR